MFNYFLTPDKQKLQATLHQQVKAYRRRGKKKRLQNIRRLGKQLAQAGASHDDLLQCHLQPKHGKDQREMLPLLALLTGYGHHLRKAKANQKIKPSIANDEVNRTITALLLQALASNMREPCMEIGDTLFSIVTSHVDGQGIDTIEKAGQPVMFHHLIDRINQAVELLHASSESAPQAVPQLQRDLMLISNNLSVISEELAKCASTIHRQADDTNSKSTASSARTLQVNREMHEANDAMQQLQSAINNIVQHITDVRAACGAAVREAEAAGQRLENLDRASARAEGVVKTIHKIAAQTRMLAINATIEAQRAGDAGRGFAVVAEEVKSLALASESGTHQIRQAIDEIHAASNAVSGTMHNIAAQIRMTNSQIADVSHIAALQKEASVRVSRIISGAISNADATVEDFNQLDLGAKAIRQEAVSMDTAANNLRACIDELTTSVVTITGQPQEAAEEAIELF